MITTPPPELQLCEEDIDHLQRIINIYHGRLNAAWATHFPGEAVPSGHENAPDITSWAPSEISRVLQNFKRHLLCPRYGHYLSPSYMRRYALCLIGSAQRLADNCDLTEQVSRYAAISRRIARSIARDDLAAVKQILGVDEAGEMRPLWIDPGPEEKQREMFAKRVANRDV
ncbi:hypothetical protein EDC01DRAFT_782302 [Geopyxis carbonaria]|nr:hypothetical protein EDC01DRAFT_782302 [Geopyxis carbonaria]